MCVDWLNFVFSNVMLDHGNSFIRESDSPIVMLIILQLPRLYNVYKEMGIVTSFQNILDNIFLPLFEVTVNPDSHPQLHVFLKQVEPNRFFSDFILSSLT